MLLGAFNMPAADYKRFLMVLRRHQCHIHFQSFRTMPAVVAAELASH
jgi:hypothetical protein